MKKKILMFSLIFVCLFSAFTLVGCGNNDNTPPKLTGTQATFKDFTKIDDENYTYKVSNDINTLNFNDIVTIAQDSKWQLSKNISGTNLIPSKVGTLSIGDNVYYIMVTDNKDNVAMYKLSIRRKPIYNLNFQIENGSFTPLTIEEDQSFPTQVVIPTTKNYSNFKLGQQFTGWFNDKVQFTDSNGNVLVDGTMQENIILTAQFSVKSEMSNFTFTSTSTTCEITGVKDSTTKTINVPSYVTSITKGAFQGCTQLESLKIPFVGKNRETTSGSEMVMGYIFGYYSYTLLHGYEGRPTGTTQQYVSGNEHTGTYERVYYDYYIPKTLKNVEVYSTKRIPERAFYKCNMIEEIKLPNDLTRIEQDAFYGTKYYETDNLDSYGVVYIQNYLIDAREVAGIYTVKEGTIFIAEYAFSYSRDLTKVIIPDTVVRIGSHAFNFCDKLTSINLPNSIKVIEDGAFYYCLKLEQVIIPKSVEEITGSIFSNISDLITVVYCELEENEVPDTWYDYWYCFQDVVWGYEK